jgi:hypothetical protein
MPLGVVEPVFEFEVAFPNPNPANGFGALLLESAGLFSAGFAVLPKEPKRFGGADIKSFWRA